MTFGILCFFFVFFYKQYNIWVVRRQQCWCSRDLRLLSLTDWFLMEILRRLVRKRQLVTQAQQDWAQSDQTSTAEEHQHISPHILTSYIPMMPVRDTETNTALDCSFPVAYLKKMFHFSCKLAKQKAEGILLIYFLHLNNITVTTYTRGCLYERS